MSKTPLKLGFLISPTPDAQMLGQLYLEKHQNTSLEEANIIIVIGGDGFMLHSLHQYQHLHKPMYGINCGSVGFLMNVSRIDELLYRLEHASVTKLFALKMSATTTSNQIVTAFAINEVSLFRQSSQAAKIQIAIDGIVRLEELTCDGILIATPAGSTAYNLSAHGPIIPIGANLLALTPISPFRPRRWRGALLADNTSVTVTVLTPDFRPTNAAADDQQVSNIKSITVSLDKTRSYELMFDPDHNLESRLLQEQFTF